ncbi:MAG: tetratricopeptide repeat protein [Bacteroidota bacterium]
MFRHFIYYICLLIPYVGVAQNNIIDSLKQSLVNAKPDSIKANNLLDIAFKLRTSDPDEGIIYAQRGLALADSIGWKTGRGKGYNTLANNYKAKSDYTKALESFQRALTIFEDLGRKRDVALVLMNIGSVYRPLKNYDKAIDYYKKALPIAQSCGDKKLTAQLFGNMGVVYFARGKYDEQQVANEKALQLFREVKDADNESWILSNMADYYAVQQEFEKAIEYQKKAIVIYDSLGNLSYKSSSLESIGAYYIDMARQKKYESIQRSCLLNGVEYLNQAKVILKELEDYDYLKNVYNSLSSAEVMLGNYEDALAHYQMYVSLKDSIFSIEAQESVAKLETKRELEVRDKEIVIQQLKKRTERIYMFVGVFFLLVVIGFIAIAYRNQKKSKELVSYQKHLVEEKQQEIVDSINYARRIQYALLAHTDFLKQYLPDHFVLFKPKDIVSGDFYWATSTDDHFYLAVCDSTGHGVPGAFMSLLSISFLNEAINEKKITKPDEVFNFVRSRLIDQVSKEGQKDGFDGILVCLDKKNKKLTYAAANNAPLLVRDNIVHKLESDRMPVGVGENKSDFRLFTVDLEANDKFYLYTDGFSDQFGGPDGKKFMSKNLNRLILEINQQPMQQQAGLLFTALNSWKKSLEQVDDVCVAGFKF